MVLPERIELSTSPLPRECSTTELRQHPDAADFCHIDPGSASCVLILSACCFGGHGDATMIGISCKRSCAARMGRQ
jgi:hypothetical protein